MRSRVLVAPGLPRGEQRAGLFQRRQRVAVPVHVDHVQVLAGLIAGPVTHQVIGHLGHPGLQRPGQAAATVDHPEAVPIGGDPQRHQHAVDRDGLHELGVEVQVAADIARMGRQPLDRDHRAGDNEQGRLRFTERNVARVGIICGRQVADGHVVVDNVVRAGHASSILP